MKKKCEELVIARMAEKVGLAMDKRYHADA